MGEAQCQSRPIWATIYGEKRIEDILQEDVMMVSCDAMLPCDEPAYWYVRNPMTPLCLTAFCHQR